MNRKVLFSHKRNDWATPDTLYEWCAVPKFVGSFGIEGRRMKEDPEIKSGSGTEEFRKQALAELEHERFRQAVEAEKLRLKRPWYKKLMPYKITIRIERR